MDHEDFHAFIVDVFVLNSAVSRHIADHHHDVIKRKYFRATDPLWGESTGHRWIPVTKANDAKLWRFF